MHSSLDLSFRQGVFYVAIAATAWGTGGAVAAELYDVGNIGPVSVSFWRFLTGLGLLLTAHLVRRARRPHTAVSLHATFLANKRRLLITGFGLAVYQTAYFAAVQQAGLSVATVVTLGSGPVLVSVGARLLLGERAGAAGAAAVASSVVGLVLLMGGADGSTGPAPSLGIGYALLSAAGYASVTLLGRASGRKSSGGAFESTVTGFAVGTVCLLPLALLEGLLPEMEQAVSTVALIGYLGAIPAALAYTLFFAGLSVVRASTASVVALVEPLTAAVIGIAVFGERLNALVGTGTVLLMGAVLFLVIGEGQGRAPARETPEAEAGCGRGDAPTYPARSTKD